MAFIEIKDLSYAYENKLILDTLSLNIEQNEYIAIMGTNGSGKSTLARCLNGILKPQKGTITIDKHTNELNRYVGMVFQNPDNQFVSSLIYEDLFFYPTNLGINKEQIAININKALNDVGMQGYENRLISTLSGGQKQKIAIASILAADVEIIIFDEATSMLDPLGKEELLDLLDLLHKQGKTIITITHDINEAIRAKRILILNKGKIVKDDIPYNLLASKEILMENNIEVPLSISLYYDLKKNGIVLKRCPINEKELVELICQLN